MRYLLWLLPFSSTVTRFPATRGRHYSLTRIPPPRIRGLVLTTNDLTSMFVEDPGVRGTGRDINDEVMGFGIGILRASPNKNPGVLIGSYWALVPGTFALDWAENNRGVMLRRLAREGGVHGSKDWHWSQWVEAIRRSHDRVYIPYNLNQNHWIIVEIVFKSGYGEYLKVWDGMKTWSGHQARDLNEIALLRDVFFQGRDVNVLFWEAGDPTQEWGHGCGAFAFMVLCHICQDKKPFAWTAGDEAICRTFLWGSILKGQLLELPQERVKVVLSL